MPGTAVVHRESSTPDGVLVQEAAAGSGTSYAALYDRHAEHVYNYCLRLTGSPDDAADATQEAFLNVLRRLQADDRPVLEFSSYLFAAARNESYALMRGRMRVQPAEEPPEERGRPPDVETEPEPAALLRDTQEAVREANAKLAPRHREVLALRELNGRSYDEIGRIMGISGNGAAQLIWRARTKLREAMTAGAVGAVVATSTDCERAQLLLSRIQDGEPVDHVDRDWLDEHLEHCGSCRAARGMLVEVGTSYRSWLPVAAIVGLKADTLTAAGHLVGADWSGVASGSSAGGGGGAGAGGGAAAGGGGVGGVSAGAVAAGVGVIAAVGIAISTLLTGGTPEERTAEQKQPPVASLPGQAAAKKGESAAKGKPVGTASVAGAFAASPAVARRGFGGTGAPPGGGIAGKEESKPPGAGDEGGDPRGPRSGRPGDDGAGPSPLAPRQPGGGPPADTRPPQANPPGPSDTTPRDTTPRDTTPRDTTPPPDTPSIPDPPARPDPPTPPPSSGGCTFPGPIALPSCPPGHGGTPPGQGGSPPGRR